MGNINIRNYIMDRTAIEWKDLNPEQRIARKKAGYTPKSYRKYV